MDSAVIFDVDGVLLHLSKAEEEIFFEALSAFVPTHNLSRDWNSYRIRNDDDIIAEILERNGKAAALKQDVIAHYLATLEKALNAHLKSSPVPGASELLQNLHGKARLGIATANLLTAAQLRLQHAKLWDFVGHTAQGADGGGHKRYILARLLQRIDLTPSRVVYVGDNLNDFEAGTRNGVHFIGFSIDPEKRRALSQNGALLVTENHLETLHHINALLA
jgi:HAD superfamily hydrolase (TIGR01549 family)